MVKILHVPLSDDIHELFLKIQKEQGFENQSETLEYVIKKAVEKE